MTEKPTQRPGNSRIATICNRLTAYFALFLFGALLTLACGVFMNAAYPYQFAESVVHLAQEHDDQKDLFDEATAAARQTHWVRLALVVAYAGSITALATLGLRQVALLRHEEGARLRGHAENRD